MSFYICALCFVQFLFFASAKQQCNEIENGPCHESDVTSFPGHWPVSYCRITNLAFDLGERVIRINSGSISNLEKCFKTSDIWKFAPLLQHEENDIGCDQTFEKGQFFTVYYYHGSNYFHLHYDTLIPLYQALFKQTSKTPEMDKETVLLPAVEATRGEGLDWETEAFMNPEAYWMQMLKIVSAKHKVLPLDRRLSAINKTMCFKEAYFGTPRVNYSDPSVLNSYITYVKKALGVSSNKENLSGKPKIGLIHREGRRRILNEEKLVKSVSAFATVEAIDFSKMSVEEQIWKVQDYTVLIGVNGAGLANALYLPKDSVAVQLVPYKAQLNVEEFANILHSRGPYLEWHNTHPEMNHPAPGDPFSNGADTEVRVEEFVDIVKKALKLYIDRKRT